MTASIHMTRLKNEILELANIGRDPQDGISRPSFSEADLKAREWLKGKPSWQVLISIL